jgi:hypothetical protein
LNEDNQAGGKAMKSDRHGQAKILTVAEMQLLFNEGFTVNPPRDRALFAVCLYTAGRISEAVTLRQRDVLDSKGNIRPEIIIRKGNTKGKLAPAPFPSLPISDPNTRLISPERTPFTCSLATKSPAAMIAVLSDYYCRSLHIIIAF